jgi:hypothetical protein
VPEIDLLQIARGTVTAPAGCGKTHLVADAVTRHDGAKPILVLTHTNAGVAALRNRLERAAIPTSRYRVATIDGWAMRLVSMFPKRSDLDPAVLTLSNPRTHYPATRRAAVTLLKAGHISDIIAASYARLIVDEYQDCSLPQHAVAAYLAQVLPACVLGDPLQAIFGFNEALVEWDAHVHAYFPPAGELQTPWRWRNAGQEAFGHWLLDVRNMLLAGRPIDLTKAPPNVKWVELDGTEDHVRRLKAGRAVAKTPAGGVLIIGDSTNPRGQRDFASQTPGATAVESVDLKDVVSFARDFDLASPDALQSIVTFAEDVMTNVGGTDLMRRVGSHRNGTARKPPTDAEQAALRFLAAPSNAGAIEVLVELGKQAGVRSHRPTVLQACIKALRGCPDHDRPGLEGAALRAREQYRALGRTLPKRAVGSTLLLKGLEAEVAVILNPSVLNRTNLYVAMTRGSETLIVCSRTSTITPL